MVGAENAAGKGKIERVEGLAGIEVAVRNAIAETGTGVVSQVEGIVQALESTAGALAARVAADRHCKITINQRKDTHQVYLSPPASPRLRCLVLAKLVTEAP